MGYRPVGCRVTAPPSAGTGSNVFKKKLKPDIPPQHSIIFSFCSFFFDFPPFSSRCMMASLTTSTAGYNSSMIILALLTLLFSLVTCETPLSTQGASTNSKTYTLFHDLDGSGKFLPRSLITLSSSDNGFDSMASRTPATSFTREAGAVSITIENIGEACVNSTSLGTGLCRLKLVDDVGHEAISAVSFCSMRRSLNLVKYQFREKLEIMVTSTGDLLSFSMTPIISPLASPCAELVKQPLSKGGNDVCFTFNTQVTVEGATTAASVPLVLPASRPPPGKL